MADRFKVEHYIETDSLDKTQYVWHITDMTPASGRYPKCIGKMYEAGAAKIAVDALNVMRKSSRAAIRRSSVVGVIGVKPTTRRIR